MGFEHSLQPLRDQITKLQLELQAAQLGNDPNYTLGAEMQRQLIAPVPAYVPASATMSTDPALLAALQSLESRMANVETNTERAAAASQKFADQFDQVSAGGNALLTEAAGWQELSAKALRVQRRRGGLANAAGGTDDPDGLAAPVLQRRVQGANEGHGLLSI